MTPRIKAAGIPVLIITLGTGWLLTVQGILPGVNWVWVVGLGMAGVLTMALGGIDKFTMLVGPFLIVSSGFSLLRQTGRLTVDSEVPCLVILFGILLLIVQLSPLQAPKWLIVPPEERQ